MSEIINWREGDICNCGPNECCRRCQHVGGNGSERLGRRETDASKVQALPTKSSNSRDVLRDLLSTYSFGEPIVWPALELELTARVELGVRKYGTRLETDNGRDVILDIRQELLDGVMYSHQGVMQGERVAHIRNTCLAALKALDEYQKAMGRI